jgi:putative transposase
MNFTRSFRYKLSPTTEQEQLFRQFSGVCRLIYNVALEQRRDWWVHYKRNTGKTITAASQSAEVSIIRRDVEWVAAVPRSCLEHALRDLDKAYASFFSKKTGFPRMRRKVDGASFRVQAREIAVNHLNAKWSAVRLPKIGWVKFRDTRPIFGCLKNATISLDALGWHISFACEIEREVPSPCPGVVGIDRGVATTLALSTGEMLTVPASLKRIEVQGRQAQRFVAKRKRGSNRRRRAKKRVARLQARQARIRRDFHHRAAASIAERFGVAVLEDLKTRNMTTSAKGTLAEPGRNVRQKAGLNRAILNAGWHQFATILTYKMEERGGQVVSVPARFTSQTCAACGVVDPRSRESQASFVCVSCGHSGHADHNAAINIKRRWSTPLLDVEGLHQRPFEASTRRDFEVFENPRSLSGGDANYGRQQPG